MISCRLLKPNAFFVNYNSTSLIVAPDCAYMLTRFQHHANMSNVKDYSSASPNIGINTIRQQRWGKPDRPSIIYSNLDKIRRYLRIDRSRLTTNTGGRKKRNMLGYPLSILFKTGKYFKNYTAFNDFYILLF